MNPWMVDLLVVRNGQYDGGERRALSRDVEHGVRVRVRPGVYIDHGIWSALDEHERHVVRMRALVAGSESAVVFSHWSAAVVHRLPFLGDRHLTRIHITVPEQERRGSRTGVAAHVFGIGQRDVVRVGELLVTSPARTVVDVAGACPFDEGVVIADGALRAHLPRHLLEQAVDLAGPRRATPRILDVVAFAHPGGESPAESESRVVMLRTGIEPPELQHEFRDREGFVGRTDTWWKRVRGIGEVDGRKKYLDPLLAPAGVGRVVFDEKLREDRLRAQADGLARWGWEESRSPRLLLPILARLGIRPLDRRPTLEEWAELAREARPAPLLGADRVLLGG